MQRSRNKKRLFETQYIELLQKTNGEMKIMAHDFLNHLSYVRHLETSEQKNAYLDKMIGKVDTFNHTALTNNIALDVILNKYKSMCANSGIAFHITIESGGFGIMEDIDIIALFTNLLDNALASAKCSREKVISLSLKRINPNMELLCVKNSCDLQPHFAQKELLTQKADKEHHGIGLKSVNNVCRKYRAIHVSDYKKEKRMFITTVLLPVSKGK